MGKAEVKGLMEENYCYAHGATKPRDECDRCVKARAKLLARPGESDIIHYLEIANEALKDADIFDFMAKKLDLTDKAMRELRDRLTNYLEVSDGML